MRLLTSATSPYARKVQMVALEKGLTLDLTTVVPPIASSPVAEFNPLGKIPTLVRDDGRPLYDSRVISVDMTFSATHNSNKLISLGFDPGGHPIPIVGLNTTVQQVPGYPLNGYWSRPYTYVDADGNKLLSPTEIGRAHV